MTSGDGVLLAVAGLKAEARIAQGRGVVAVAGGGDQTRLEQRLAEVSASGARAVLSFGIAGGLAPGLPPGTVIVAGGVDDGGTRWPADPHWRALLLASLPQALCGDLIGVDQPIAGPADKARLHARSGALAVDMESHVAARFASRHGLPFAALRVVADPAERTLPRAALVGMRPDGSTDVGAVLRALVQKPAELSGLIRTALDAKAAFAALRLSRALAGADYGLSGLMSTSGERSEEHPRPLATGAII